MRAFIGLPLDTAATDALAPLRDGLGQGRGVPDDNLHVTLVFLDDQPEPVLQELHLLLDALSFPAFEIVLSGVEARGGRMPSLVWAGVEGPAALTELHGRIRSVVRAAGIDLPRARFRPHVTLARFGRTRPADLGRLEHFLSAQGGFRAGPFAIDRVCLYASTLTPEGPIYEVLAEYPLR